MVVGIIISFFIGAVIGLILTMVSIRKNRLLFTFMLAQRKKQGIAFMEDESKKMVERVVESFQNLSITESGQLIVITPGSVKPVAGTMIQTVNADLYKSITTPFALRRFIYERVREGWTADDIADFLEDIEKMNSDEDLKDKYKELKLNSEIKETLEKEMEELKRKLSNKKIDKGEKAILTEELKRKMEEYKPFKKLGYADKHKYDIFLSLPSSISAFVNTGLNRTSINLQDELKQITRQKMLGKKAAKWMGIMIGIGFAVLLIFMGLKIGGPVLADLIGNGAVPAAPSIPTPNRIAP